MFRKKIFSKVSKIRNLNLKNRVGVDNTTYELLKIIICCPYHKRRYDTQHNDIQRNDTQHDN